MAVGEAALPEGLDERFASARRFVNKTTRRSSANAPPRAGAAQRKVAMSGSV
jgi:hypothetical protein